MLYLSKLYIEAMLEYPTWVLITDFIITSIPIFIIVLIIKGVSSEKKDNVR
jgi:hypothetical protein